MRQLTNEELEVKIATFMRERLADHPELEHTAKKHQFGFGEKVVSGVQRLSNRFNIQIPTNHTLYQA